MWKEIRRSSLIETAMRTATGRLLFTTTSKLDLDLLELRSNRSGLFFTAGLT
jgi:hypothetical protein